MEGREKEGEGREDGRTDGRTDEIRWGGPRRNVDKEGPGGRQAGRQGRTDRRTDRVRAERRAERRRKGATSRGRAAARLHNL